MLFGSYQEPAAIRSSELTLNQGNLTLTHATNGHITASGNISASGLLYASSSQGNYSNIVVQDTASGRFYTTASSAIGGGDTF